MATIRKFGEDLRRRMFGTEEERKLNIEEIKENYKTDLHLIPLEELVSKLSTNVEQGLSSFQAKLHLTRDGPNSFITPDSFVARKKASLSMITTVLLFSLLAAFCFIVSAVPSLRPRGTYYLDNLYLGILLALSGFLVAIISWCLAKRSARIMRSVIDMHPKNATVIRDDDIYVIDVNEIVVGDLILLKSGDFVPADLRLVESEGLQVDESSTGGNVQWKHSDVYSDNPTEAENVLFYGTYCTQGRGKGIVIATGSKTLMAHLNAHKTSFKERMTFLQQNILLLVSTTGYGCVCFAIILFGFGFLVNIYWLDSLIYLSVMVVIIRSEILSLVTRESLITAAKRMATRKCFVKNLETVEKLGSISIICCDKRNFLTSGKPVVEQLWMDSKAAIIDESNIHEKVRERFSEATWTDFMRAASLCCSPSWRHQKTSPSNKYEYQCDRIDATILNFLNELVLSVTHKTDKYRKIFEIPFTHENRYTVTVHELRDETEMNSFYLMSMKGAPELLLGFCSRMLLEGRDVPITPQVVRKVNNAMEEMMSTGLSVIGFCDTELFMTGFPPDYKFQKEDIPLRNLRFLGLMGLRYPLYPKIEESVKKCRDAGVKVVLVTGDHPLVAEIIARQTGVISPKNVTREEVAVTLNIPSDQVVPGSVPAVVVQGKELEEKSAADIVNILNSYQEVVLARLTPNQRLLIVQAYQQLEQSVAVTANTIHAAEALKTADVGIGLGTDSCDFCFDSADIILLNNGLDAFWVAFEEGRSAIENIEKSIIYAVASYLTGIIPFVLMLLLQIPLLMGTALLLIFFFVAEMLPIIALTQEQENSHEKTIKQKSKIISKRFFFEVIQKGYGQINVIKALAGVLSYLIVMAENGFLPVDLVFINHLWYTENINDLKDSYNQEWTYLARMDLLYTSQTAFFISVLIMHWFTLVICRTRGTTLWNQKCRNHYLNLVFIFGIMLAISLSYIPGVHKLHIFPVRFIWWLPSIPFGVLLVAYNELHRFLTRHSPQDSWLSLETF